MGNARNTVAYFKKQVAEKTAVVPTSNVDGYLSIEKPDVTTGQRELLESELLSGSIGVKKPQLGMETASASVTTEVRSHGDTSLPTEPDFGILLESAIGTPNISVAESVSATPAPSTSEFGFSTEGNIKRYDLLIISNATDGRVARFAESMKLDVLTGANDAIDFNEGAAELNATLSAGTYLHGGSAVSGSIGEEIKTQLEAAGANTYTVDYAEQANGSYKYTITSDGTFSLLIATGTNTANAFLKLNLGFGAADLTGALTYEAASAIHGNRVVCNIAMTNAPTAADVINATVNYKPLNEGHAHFTSGFYQANSDVDGYFEQLIGCLVSSMSITVETGVVAKFAFEMQALEAVRTALTKASHIPSYEDEQGLVGFNVETYLGSSLIDANNLEISVEDEVSEKKSFKEASGKVGSIVRKRTITGTVNPYADGSVDLYNALNNLTDYKMMVVIGAKDAGGFILGKTVAFFMPQIMITQTKTGDIDDNMIEELNFSAHTGSSGNKLEFVASFG